MATAMMTGSETMTANALWTLIKPQKRGVRVYLEGLLQQSFAEDNAKQTGNGSRTRAERFAEIFKDVKHIQRKALKKDSFIESLGTEIELPAGFDEKEAYRKHLEEKYR